MSRLLCSVLVALLACGGGEPKATQPTNTANKRKRSLPPLLSELALPVAAGSVVDGENDGDQELSASAISWLTGASGTSWEKVDAPATAHPVVCDAVPFLGALFVSHAVEPLDQTGSRIHRYDPRAKEGERWTLAFDYNGGTSAGFHSGGGQGLSRLRVIYDRLFAVDSDSTSRGFFGLSDGFAEAYLFVSDKEGNFASPDSGVPARVRTIKSCLHALDVIEFRGALIATGGTGLFDEDRPRWPGALWIGDGASKILTPKYPLGLGAGVVRTSFMHRFKGRLYVGFQNNEARAKFDLAILTDDPRAADAEPPVLARVTDEGGWLTRRFASGDGTLYWVATGYPRRDKKRGALFRSNDGIRFERVQLPPAAGVPQDVVVVSGAVFLLTNKGLYRSKSGSSFELLAAAPSGDPFGHFETFCSAPLTVFDDALYAGSTRDGALYRVIPR